MKPDYGIDAPGVRRAMALAGGVGFVLAGLGVAASLSTSGWLSAAATVVVVCAGLAALYGLGMATYMTYGSRIGKLHTREHLLDLAATIVPHTGNETILDVGCGRGLMLIGAARRLTGGQAIGIDLWHNEDQGENSPEATLENARREGLSDRVSVKTGDARALPFADGAFDLVMSHWVVHNLPDAGDRMRVLDEMLRVLRPGGVLVLADIAHHADYLAHLSGRGLAEIQTITGGLESQIIGALSGGTFRPQALVGRRV